MAIYQCIVCLLLHLTVITSQQILTIGAFNVRTFGRSKMSDPVRASRIAQITARYDIMLLQEIRDSSGNSLRQLLELVKEFGNYNMVVSERLGRTSYKEQYAYFYRTDTLQVLGSHQFDDGVDDGTDRFEREPFSVLVLPTNSCTVFAMIALHSKPTNALAEINALDDVRKDVVSKWNVQNVMILGDLNADCSYADESELSKTKLVDPAYKWLIDSTRDTTTGTTDCAYDRIITRGKELDIALIKGSTDVYLFNEKMNLTGVEMSAISDHYPVEIQLQFQHMCDPCSSEKKTCSHSASPQQYCSCLSGRPVKLRCKQTELWQDEQQACQSVCPPFQSIMIKHPSICKQYIQCIWGFPIVFNCPNFPLDACRSSCK